MRQGGVIVGALQPNEVGLDHMMIVRGGSDHMMIVSGGSDHVKLRDCYLIRFGTRSDSTMRRVSSG